MILGQGVKGSISTLALCIKPCGHDTDYSFCRITFKLHMQVVDDERRNPIDFWSGVKGQGQLWHSVYKTLWARCRLHFSPITSKLHMQVVDGERRDYWFWVTGSKVKVNFGTLCIKPAGTIQTTVFAKSLSNFTCKLWMMRGETLLILGQGIKGQGQLWHSV